MYPMPTMSISWAVAIVAPPLSAPNALSIGSIQSDSPWNGIDGVTVTGLLAYVIMSVTA
jgi:hypothetical protein